MKIENFRVFEKKLFDLGSEEEKRVFLKTVDTLSELRKNLLSDSLKKAIGLPVNSKIDESNFLNAVKSINGLAQKYSANFNIPESFDGAISFMKLLTLDGINAEVERQKNEK